MTSREKKHKQLKALFHRQRGLCIWCGKGMVPPWQHQHKNGQKMNRRLCTLDHLDDRYSEERGRHGNEYRRVAACWQCNNARGAAHQQQISKEELWRRSGAYPQDHPLATRDRGSMRIGETATFAFLRHGEPLPEHAELASDLQGCSHGQHAILIRFKPPKQSNPDEQREGK